MKSSENEWFSAKELEKLELDGLPRLATNITRKAQKEKWTKRNATGVKGGGYEYHVSSFPLETKKALTTMPSFQFSSVAQPSQELDDEVLMIDSYDSITVSAGFGSFNDGVTQPDGAEPYAEGLLARLGVNAHQCAVFWASGNSMFPTIHNGDQLLVDLSRKTVRGDKIYLVQNGESVWVKRVKILWDGVELISDNREEYPPIHITQQEAEHLQIIGQVVHVGHSLA